MLGIDQSEQEQGGELLRPHVETSKLADFNEDVNLKPIQLQTIVLLMSAFFLHSSALLHQHQIIILIGGLAG